MRTGRTPKRNGTGMAETEQKVEIRPPTRVDVALKRSGNRKLSPVIHWRERRIETEGAPVVLNSFGVLSSACKHTTPFCESCYARQAEKYPNVGALLAHNTVLTTDVDYDRLVVRFDQMVMDTEIEMVKRGVPLAERWFRPYWDGDLRSLEEFGAWNQVASYHPDMRIFLYTRAHEYVERALLTSPLWRVPLQPNFQIYLSVDRYNVATAQRVKRFDKRNRVRLAFCGDTWEETREVAAHFPDERVGPRCPELTGKIPLIVWESDAQRDSRKAEADRRGVKRFVKRLGKGACVACGMCPNGINNVRFSVQKG